jgi:hypothetical protein
MRTLLVAVSEDRLLITPYRRDIFAGDVVYSELVEQLAAGLCLPLASQRF